MSLPYSSIESSPSFHHLGQKQQHLRLEMAFSILPFAVKGTSLGALTGHAGGSGHIDASSDKSTVYDESSGFHLLEIHMPTVGKGLSALVTLALISLLFVCLGKRLKRAWERKRARQAALAFYSPPHRGPFGELPGISHMGMPCALGDHRDRHPDLEMQRFHAGARPSAPPSVDPVA